MLGPTSIWMASIGDWLSRQWELTLDALHSQQRLVLVSAIAVIFGLWLLVKK